MNISKDVFANVPISVVILVLLLPSLISIITIVASVINNKIQTNSQIKLKRMDIDYNQKIQIIKDFANAYANLSESTYNEFVSSGFLTMTIADNSTQEKILELMGFFDEFHLNKCGRENKVFAQCMKMLSSDIIIMKK